MSVIIKSLAAGSLGFDVNESLLAYEAKSFKASGYDFCIRYIPRTSALIKGNLTKLEVETILTAGLALSVVQHVALPGWEPTADLGTQYGKYAEQYAAAIELPKGINIWLDLEEVATHSTVQNVIDYCKAWYNAVAECGYVPGIYCGYGTNLSSEQLYNLPFKHYWKAYNGPEVANRGYQIIQHTQKMLNGLTFDPNVIQADNKGDLPIFACNSNS